MKYNEYKDLNYAQLEADILEFWEENQIFEKSISSREGKKTFTFYEGPPSANGMPGIHHVMARTIKDIFCRYKTLKGFQVKRKAGWDTHGLPVELKVEQQLGITKDDIGKKISVEDYNKECRKTVMQFTDIWSKLTQKMGYWVDMGNPYITYHNDYIETVWYLLKKLHEKDWLYKGYTIQPFSPKAGTGLSSHELNMPGAYKDVTDTSIVAQFKVKRSERSEFLFENDDEDVRILAWTTTPWTLPSNCALAVGEKITYVKVKTFNAYTHQPVSVVLAKDLVSKHFSDKAKDLKLEDYKKEDKLIPFEIVQEFKGADITEVRYEQLMPYVTNEELEKNAFRVIPGDFVTTADGTGVVHTASVFGADDYRVAQQNNVPAVLVKDEEGNSVPLVDRQGRFVKEVTDFAGLYVKSEYEDNPESVPEYKSTDVLISIKLKTDNKAFKVEKYKHSYPHCWRTDKPVLYYPLDSWFIRTTAAKEKLVQLNHTINWKPESTGTGRFGNWLENLVDWNLSRQRYWGIPLPIWRTEDGKEEICIGSVYELYEAVEKSIKAGLMKENPVGEFENVKEVKTDDDGSTLLSADVISAYFKRKNFDLHRPYVDDIILVSPNGKPMYREPDLIDVWFDSGAMPYAQLHYPFQNKELIDERNEFPADFISEGVDQTRGWFFTLHAIAGMLFDSVAFKNVVSTGLVLDAEGRKMSKRLGNAVDPFETMDAHGADTTRWYMISNANPWDNLKFDIEGVKEVSRRFFGTLKNTYSFFATYANLDGFDYSQAEVPVAQRPEIDRWILSKLNTLIKQVDGFYDDFEPTKAARAIQTFTMDDLSNWYVRLNRNRFWKTKLNDDKVAAYQTLYTCLETILKLASPVMPFMSEALFLDLNKVSGRDQSESIHLTTFPEVNEDIIDSDLERRMTLAQKLSSLTHSLRKTAKGNKGIRVRQPLQKIIVPAVDATTQGQIEAVKDLILAETNIKDIEFIGANSDIVVKSIKPNFKVLGKKYGKDMKKVQGIINAFSNEDIATIDSTGALSKEGFDFITEDVVILSEVKEGHSVATDPDEALTVILDETITEDLRKEGIARDFVNRVQNLRKDTGMEVTDKIGIVFNTADDLVKDALNTHHDYISTETQALSLADQTNIEGGETLEIEDFTVTVKIEVLANVENN
jgi:isoleucyl-tRNA synthetase